MDTEPAMSPQAVCEDCWLLDHAHWEPESMDSNGSVLMKLTGVDVPEKVNDGSVEVCCLCGGITIAGIYEFRNETETLFKHDNTPIFELEFGEYGDDFL